eukprot:m.12767 g.12767  ORF g.12767 m.12767 type:complete len:785 (-) comp5862_c0_seq2:330-2684(-)
MSSDEDPLARARYVFTLLPSDGTASDGLPVTSSASVAASVARLQVAADYCVTHNLPSSKVPELLHPLIQHCIPFDERKGSFITRGVEEVVEIIMKLDAILTSPDRIEQMKKVAQQQEEQQSGQAEQDPQRSVVAGSVFGRILRTQLYEGESSPSQQSGLKTDTNTGMKRGAALGSLLYHHYERVLDTALDNAYTGHYLLAPDTLLPGEDSDERNAATTLSPSKGASVHSRATARALGGLSALGVSGAQKTMSLGAKAVSSVFGSASTLLTNVSRTAVGQLQSSTDAHDGAADGVDADHSVMQSDRDEQGDGDELGVRDAFVPSSRSGQEAGSVEGSQVGSSCSANEGKEDTLKTTVEDYEEAYPEIASMWIPVNYELESDMDTFKQPLLGEVLVLVLRQMSRLVTFAQRVCASRYPLGDRDVMAVLSTSTSVATLAADRLTTLVADVNYMMDSELWSLDMPVQAQRISTLMNLAAFIRAALECFVDAHQAAYAAQINAQKSRQQQQLAKAAAVQTVKAEEGDSDNVGDVDERDGDGLVKEDSDEGGMGGALFSCFPAMLDRWQEAEAKLTNIIANAMTRRPASNLVSFLISVDHAVSKATASTGSAIDPTLTSSSPNAADVISCLPLSGTEHQYMSTALRSLHTFQLDLGDRLGLQCRYAVTTQARAKLYDALMGSAADLTMSPAIVSVILALFTRVSAVLDEGDVALEWCEELLIAENATARCRQQEEFNRVLCFSDKQCIKLRQLMSMEGLEADVLVVLEGYGISHLTIPQVKQLLAQFPSK